MYKVFSEDFNCLFEWFCAEPLTQLPYFGKSMLKRDLTTMNQNFGDEDGDYFYDLGDYKETVIEFIATIDKSWRNGYYLITCYDINRIYMFYRELLVGKFWDWNIGDAPIGQKRAEFQTIGEILKLCACLKIRIYGTDINLLLSKVYMVKQTLEYLGITIPEDELKQHPAYYSIKFLSEYDYEERLSPKFI